MRSPISYQYGIPHGPSLHQMQPYGMFRMWFLTTSICLVLNVNMTRGASDDVNFEVSQESYERRSFGASTVLNVTYNNPQKNQRVEWYYQEIDKSNLIASLDVVAAQNSMNLVPTDNNFQDRMQFNYTESMKLMTLSISELHEEDAEKKVTILLLGQTQTTLDEINIPFNVTACPLLNDTRHGLFVSYSDEGNYLSEANHECRKGKLYVDGSVKAVYRRTCTETAKWTPYGDGVCWYDPSRVEVLQTKSIENEPLMLKCNFSNDGNPEATKYNFSFDGIMYESSMQDFHVDGRVISWKDNGKEFYCRLISQYSLASATAGYSPNKEFNVFFGVKNNGTGVKSPYIPTNSTGNFSVTIYANLAYGEVQAGMLNLAGDNVTDEMAQKLHRSDTEYIYTYSLDRSKILEKHFIFNAVTTDPPGNVSIRINIVDEPPVTTTNSGPFNSTGGPGSNLPTYVIPVVICAAVLCLILIVVLVFMIRRRQKKHAHGGDTSDGRGHEPSTSDDANREERANPLYGISHQEREERINPLYGSSGGAMMGDDIYSEVKKDKKGKKKGKENKGYSGENVGDMYAEVKKPKKNAPKPTVSEVTYAAVDKKTKKGASLNSLHGSPVA